MIVYSVLLRNESFKFITNHKLKQRNVFIESVNYITMSNSAQLLCCCFLLLLTNLTNAQSGESANWLIGRNMLNFSTSPPKFIGGNLPVKQLSQSSSYSDKSGNLLFYTSGGIVFNRNYEAMPNGKIQLGEFPTVSSTTFVVPQHNNNKRFFLFYYSQETTYKLNCCLIDMTEDSGLGNVLWKKEFPSISLRQHKEADKRTEGGKKLSVVRLANDQVMVAYLSAQEPDAINWFYISEEGNIEEVYKANFPSLKVLYGGIDISPDGKKLVCAYDNVEFSSDFSSWTGSMGLVEFDFSYETGVVNPKPIPIDGWSFVCSIAFSQDASKIYYSQRTVDENSTLNQYDSNTKSHYRLWTKEKEYIKDFKLGLDGKLYMIPQKGNGSNVSVIHNPNVSGVSCGFQYDYIVGNTSRVPIFYLPIFLKNLFLNDNQIVTNGAPCLGGNITFEATNQEAISFLWEFGDGNESNEEKPIHSYSKPGKHTVQVTLTYSDNSTEKISKQIQIHSKPVALEISYEP